MSYEPVYEPGAGTPVRGRHRVVKPRGGTMARSGAVLGVGVIAAVGAGGMASAQSRPAAPISMPDLSRIPGVGALLTGDTAGRTDAAAPPMVPGADQPLSQAGLSAEEAATGTANAGETLRARILQQAEHQQSAADDQARASVAQAAAKTQRQAAADKAAEVTKAAAEAAEAAEAKAAEVGAKAEARSREHAGAAEAQKPQSPRKAGSAGERQTGRAGGSAGGQAAGRSARSGSFTLPVGSYTLTAGFGQAGNMWSANHTGEDFAAPTGTPVKAVGSGTITQAGWAGAYGYRIVLKLDDGTELWFCHLSSMVATSGKVTGGQVIGRVGATGNVTGPHLHLEVRPGGGSPVDPLSWLRARGLQP
ncbi:peptidoglycan DD-metalloendopeptidase family protein [Streptomyces sp. ISL-11]|nr:M23 family metallopeptidase [Streptomyces sp. ISL-11]MBT2384252.1 peptidoglycan DD-metalloendopeptidase family protein [Streptomyces sp. ISL-11]